IAPSDKITLGFIGVGRQGFGLRRRFVDLTDVQIVAACDPYAAKLERFINANNHAYAEITGQASYNATSSFVDYRELLSRKDIDAVVIASPDHWHGAMAVHAAEQ